MPPTACIKQPRLGCHIHDNYCITQVGLQDESRGETPFVNSALNLQNVHNLNEYCHAVDHVA